MEGCARLAGKGAAGRLPAHSEHKKEYTEFGLLVPKYRFDQHPNWLPGPGSYRVPRPWPVFVREVS